MRAAARTRPRVKHDQTPGTSTDTPPVSRGSDCLRNYTSASFAAALVEHGVRQSVGRTGICYDNAMAESFFAILKNERVHRTVYPTRQRARADIAQYIELRYNTRRIHSGLGYCTPQEVHDAWLESQEAA